jgi:hypothetical protein
MESVLFRNEEKILTTSIAADPEFKSHLAELPMPFLAEIAGSASNYGINGDAIAHLHPGYALANSAYLAGDFMTQYERRSDTRKVASQNVDISAANTYGFNAQKKVAVTGC